MKKIKSAVNAPLTKSANLFPVAGIGASAGGLDAFKKLLKAIPLDSGIAYVLVQHLDPNHESLLPELLQKVTSIPVLEITDNIKILPDHIYIIPSSKMLIANDGKLELSPRIAKKNERNLPIDLFFSSLAEVHQSHSIGVVLSGTASDGTLGLKAIKDHGGITFAQDEASAAYEGMPHSAAQAGVVDFILPPEKIPQKLLEVIKIIAGNGSDEPLFLSGQLQDEEVFKQMLSLLRIRKGTDFTYYKQTTIRRRILRRMALNKNEEPVTYLKYLRGNKQEQDILYQDLLIPVTEFFRDKKSFDNLCEIIFPHIIKNKNTPLGAGVEPIRIWVAGCSTGQEAYSIAMCFKESLSDVSISLGEARNGAVQIFATDISEPAIAKARTGIYKKSDMEGVSPQRLQEFFAKNNGDYQVKKEVRDMCVFAVHNFLKDPPFGKMDFISCRNVLIYMEPYLQKKALSTFHYSLKPHGLLWLGKSETISSVPDLFAQSMLKPARLSNSGGEGKHDKLFSRKDAPGKFMHVATQRTEQNLQSTLVNTKADPDKSGHAVLIATGIEKTADDVMLRKYTPAGVVVNEAMDIVHFRGNTSAYLEQSQGKPTHNLLKLAKSGLAFELRNILHKAKNLPTGRQETTTVIKENIPIQAGGSLRNISIEAIPLNTIEPHYLILFHEANAIGNKQSAAPGSGNKKKISTPKTKKDDKDLLIQQLEQELAQIREDMRSITEDQEAVNEELQSANEELLSSSEELQSLNEELETGKEELQSTNEELTVVNQEMIALNEQVAAARDYAENIVTTIRQPLLVLDKNLRIKTGNKSFYKTFQVNEQETEGILIYDIGNKQWNIPSLRMLLEKIITEKSKVSDFEVTNTFPTIGERTMLLNASEVISQNNAEKLILLSIEDITEQRKAHQVLSLLSTIVDSSEDAIISKTLDGIITSWNKGSEKIFGYSPEEAIGKHITILIPPELQKEEEMIIGKIKKGEPVLHFDTVRLAKDGKRINISLTVSPISDSSGKITGASKIARDITEQVNARQQIEESEKRYEMMVMQSPFAFAVLKGKDMVVTLANDSVKQMWGKGKAIEGKPLIEVLPEIKDQVFPALLDEVYTTGIPYTTSETLARLVRNGKMEDVYFNFVYQPYREPDKSISGVVIIATEVTPQAVFNKKIKASEENFRQLADLMPEKVTNTDAEGNVIYFNQNWLDYTGRSFDELKGWEWEKIIHPDDLEKNKNKWKQALTEGTNLETEERLLNKDGEYKWHLSRVTPVKDEAGKITKWISTTTEIQEQKDQREVLEKAVKESTRELLAANEELVQKNQEIALSKYNKKFLTEFSDRFAAYKSHDEFFNAAVTYVAELTKIDYVLIGNLEPAGDNQFAIKTIAITAFGKLIDNINYPLPNGPCEQIIRGTLYSYPEKCKITFPENQTLVQFNVEGYIGYPLFDAQENAIGLIAVMHEKEIEDTETVSSILKIVAKRTEIELERIKYEKQLEQNNQALKEKNIELIKMNAELQRADEEIRRQEVVRESEKNLRNILEGLTQLAWRSEPDGMHIYFNRQWYDYTGQTEEETMNEGWTDALHPDDREWAYSMWRKTLKDKTSLDVDYRLRAKDGSYHWFLTRARPFFDANNNLTAYIGTCTNIDDAKNLQKDMERSQKHREDFIKMASHELKTPITTIKGYVQLMLITLKDGGDAKISPLLVKQSMATIDRQVNKLTRLISEMLDLSRIEAGQLELTREVFNLNELVIETVQDILYANIGHTINITNDFECSVNGDRDRIGQVISNLLGNAIKYSPNSDRIEVRIFRQAKNLAAVSVKDHGIGIDKEYQRKIFEPFFRADGKSEQTYPGFGVGLYIASEITKRHNGTLSVESGKGNGSTFTFTLPVAEETKNK